MLRLRSFVPFALVSAPFAMIVAGAVACSSTEMPPADVDASTADAAANTDAGSEADSAIARPQVSDECKRYAVAHCAALNRCSPFGVDSVYGGTPGCQAEISAICGQNAKLAGVVFDEACAQGFATQACDEVLREEPPAACAGKLALGKSCLVGQQCASGYCSADSFAACGVCYAPKTGDACGASGPRCAKTDWCDTNDKCVSFGKANEACSTKRSPVCDIGLTCEKTSATCVPRAKAGADCTNVECATGLYCEKTSATCKARTPVGAGQPFDNFEGTYCPGSSRPIPNGTCEPYTLFGDGPCHPGYARDASNNCVPAFTELSACP